MTPLGERSRNRRWSLTMTGYLLGSVLGGAAVGAVCGAIGGILGDSLGWLSSSTTLVVLGVVILVGAWRDLTAHDLPAPTIRRQVSQSWPRRYRGFIYGFGFGIQLGAGLTTIITNTATYIAFVAALLARDWRIGILIGATYGLARAAVNFATFRITTFDRLARLHSFIERSDGPARRVLGVAQVLTGIAALASFVIEGGI